MRSLRAWVASIGVVAACGDAADTRSAPGTNDGSAGGDASVDVFVPPTVAEFGLDRRPINTSCVAPARPPSTSPAKLERVYQGVALEQTMMMAQPPGDPSRWFVSSRTGTMVSFPATEPPARPTVVADLGALAGRPVETAIEGGFLGFAFLHLTNGERMPPLGRSLVDDAGVNVIDEWIRGVRCP
ncbi:MAG: hypothetical protein KIT84_19495 [Labilithrix sp.]|nr:hypothetical protein [Labilithrix sp.]MCW5813221.1 hypothetical protein [Labilithrix sp.]